MPCSMTLQTRSSMPRADALEAQDLRCVGESAAVELLHAYGGDREPWPAAGPPWPTMPPMSRVWRTSRP